MVPVWDGTLGQAQDHNHDHDHEDKQRIILISLWNKRKKGVKKKSANSNKYKLIRNWHFLNGLNWRFCKSIKRVK